MEETALAERPSPQQETLALVSMFERLAKDPAVDVEKLERLIQLQERILRHNAVSAFNAAFSRMQSVLPEIDEHGKICVNGIVRSTYAKLEDIHKVIKPILKEYGFAIRHRTEWPAEKAGIIRIVGILSHEQGHSEESVFEAPADKSQFRSDIQSMGSTVSYGRRYTTMDLLNIATRGVDNDGQKGTQKATDPRSRLTEDQQARIARMFATLKLTPAQQLARVNQFLVPTKSPDDAFEALVKWGEAEYRKEPAKVDNSHPATK